MLIPVSFAFTYPKDGKMQIKTKDSKHILQSMLTQAINCVFESNAAVLMEVT